MKDRIGKVERRRVNHDGVLFYEEWKLVKRYTYKASASRDQRRQRTASDKGA